MLVTLVPKKEVHSGDDGHVVVFTLRVCLNPPQGALERAELKII